MHLRRALLLFAIVLGLAAVAASVSRPGRSSDTEQPFRTPPATTDDQPTVTAAAGPKPGLAPVERTFLASEPGPQRIHAGQAATILVDVSRARSTSPT